MLPTIRVGWYVIGFAAAALALGGCAADAIRSGAVSTHHRRAKADSNLARKEAPSDIDTGSIPTQDPVTSKKDPRWQWCEQRHIDHQAGKAPGGATDLAKKLEDDRICAAVYQRG